MKCLARWITAFGFFAFPLLVQAGSEKLPAHGGGNGTSFNLDCGDDRVLVGVAGKKGAWLDQLKALCTEVEVSNGRPQWLGLEPDIFGPAGGSNGTDFQLTCPRDSAVRGMSGRFGWYVNRLNLRCVRLGAFGDNETIHVHGSQRGDHSFSMKYCSDGKFARGFHGRAGIYVDRVGLICHTGTTPRLQRPPEFVVFNVDPQTGQTTTAATPFVRVQWTDRSTSESKFRIDIIDIFSNSDAFITTIDQPAVPNVDTRQAATITGLPSGEYVLSMCAEFDEHNLCSGDFRAFRIAAFTDATPF